VKQRAEIETVESLYSFRHSKLQKYKENIAAWQKKLEESFAEIKNLKDALKNKVKFKLPSSSEKTKGTRKQRKRR
jgi:hypothetical protein